MSKRSVDIYTLVAIALTLFAFTMSAVVSRTVFERYPHLEDEIAYLFQAKLVARGDLVIESPSPKQAFWEPFVVDHSTGTRFGKYSLGWPGLLAVGVMLGEAWVVNALLAALVVALTYRLGREIFNPETGIVAATLTAFSPMALLLNGSLMGHSAALFCALLFMYSFWRITQSNKDRLRWGIMAGIGLGLLVINRPLTAVGISAPFVLWSVVLLADKLIQGVKSKPEVKVEGTMHHAPTESRLSPFISLFKPLVALGVIALLISLIIPIFNAAATGNYKTNLYTLVWDYDQIGFGQGYGKSGHTIQKGIQFARYDLTMTAADLFGWHLGSVNCTLNTGGAATQSPESASASAFNCVSLTQTAPIPPMGKLTTEVQQHLLTQSGYFIVTGISWILIFPGLLVGLKRDWAWAWVVIGVVWLLWSPSSADPIITTWLMAGVAWMLTPLPFLIWRMRTESQPVWTWLLFATAVMLVTVHLAYWIGSQRYSTRYYYEMLSSLAIISALPIAWLMQKAKHQVLKAAIFCLLLGFSIVGLYNYSTPRINALYQFNRISQDFVDAVEARRQTDKPLLVLVTGSSARWRTRGPFMALTSPYFDSDIVAAWDNESSPRNREEILSQFSEREIIELVAVENDVWFKEDCLQAPCPAINPPLPN